MTRRDFLWRLIVAAAGSIAAAQVISARVLLSPPDRSASDRATVCIHWEKGRHLADLMLRCPLAPHQ